MTHNRFGITLSFGTTGWRFFQAGSPAEIAHGYGVCVPNGSADGGTADLLDSYIVKGYDDMNYDCCTTDCYNFQAIYMTGAPQGNLVTEHPEDIPSECIGGI
jgi:hypothetical protein